MSTAIEFNHVGKQYRLGTVSTGTLSHDLNRWFTTTILRKEDPYLKIGSVNDRTSAADSEYVWALKDIDFKIEQGDVVGIIGKNGAGKSTLLKLLSRVTGPTVGTINARGRIGSLLEVGTGFHPEQTGRENIYINGAIMGMTKQEITRKLDEIVDFSGCERYIDTPVKRYSSGMQVRLGFAVAAFLEPEILVVDEVLAVGDAEFQKKAIGKMQDVSKGEGRTVLFVSHNMASMRSLCNTGVLLENGMLKKMGHINDVVDTYLCDNLFSNEESIINKTRIVQPIVSISSITVNESIGSVVTLKYPERKIRIHIEGFSKLNIKFRLEVTIYDKKDNLLASYLPADNGGELQNVENSSFVIDETFSFPENFCNGEYFMSIEICHPYTDSYVWWDKAVKIILSDYTTQFGHDVSQHRFGLLNLGVNY